MLSIVQAAAFVADREGYFRTDCSAEYDESKCGTEWKWPAFSNTHPLLVAAKKTFTSSTSNIKHGCLVVLGRAAPITALSLESKRAEGESNYNGWFHLARFVRCNLVMPSP